MTAAWPKNKEIQLNDLFWTLQGEGRWSGYRALFIRLPFCNYECPWCDTEFNTFQKWTQQNFKKFCLKESARLAVITGGEPMIHKDLPLILHCLKDLGFKIACETNGSAPISEPIDFATVSPKPYTKNKLPPYHIDAQAFEKANEFKYIVDDQFDFQVLERHSPPRPKTTYSLSPEYSQMKTMTPKIIEFIAANPQWRLNLQTHKWINIP